MKDDVLLGNVGVGRKGGDTVKCRKENLYQFKSHCFNEQDIWLS